MGELQNDTIPIFSRSILNRIYLPLYQNIPDRPVAQSLSLSNPESVLVPSKTPLGLQERFHQDSKCVDLGTIDTGNLSGQS